MTTRIHIVNFGPDSIKVEASDPETGGVSQVAHIYAEDSDSFYVHPSQQIRVTETKPGTDPSPSS